MDTYTIEKDDVRYLYYKRRVHSNGVTTSPLKYEKKCVID